MIEISIMTKPMKDISVCCFIKQDHVSKKFYHMTSLFSVDSVMVINNVMTTHYVVSFSGRTSNVMMMLMTTMHCLLK